MSQKIPQRVVAVFNGSDSRCGATGPKDKIAEMARASGVTYDPDGANYNHNFRTLVIDAAGRLQMNFPISGDLSDHLAAEILRAAAVTNR